MKNRLYFDIEVNLEMFTTDFVSLSNGDRVDDGSFDCGDLLCHLAPKIVNWYNSNFPELELIYDDESYGGEYHYSLITVNCDKNTLNHIAGFIVYNDFESFKSFCINRYSWSETREIYDNILNGNIADHLDHFIFEYYVKYTNNFSEDIDFDIYESLSEYGSDFIYSSWEYENEDLLKLVYAVAEKVPTAKDDLRYHQISGDIWIFYTYNDNFWMKDSEGLRLPMYIDHLEIYHDLLQDLKKQHSSYEIPDYLEVRLENEDNLELIDFIISEDVLSNEK
jgi:hypothetical protein